MEHKRCKSCGKLILNEESVLCSKCGSEMHKDCALNDSGKPICDVCCMNSIDEVNTVKENVKLPTVIRRSHIESYRSCPYRAYKEIIENIQLPHSSFAQVGIDLHELFHKANIGEILTIKDMKNEFLKIFNTYEDLMFENDLNLYKDRNVQQHREHMYKIGIDSIDGYYDISKDMPNRPYMAEENIVFSIGDSYPDVSITMDRIDEDGLMLAISDYKTGHVVVGQKIVTELQPPLYIHAVRKHTGREVSKFTLYYLAEGKSRTYVRVTDDVYECKVNNRVYSISINKAIQEVKEVFSHMQNNEWSIPNGDKSMYFKCKTCPLKTANLCEGAEIESWRKQNNGGFEW